MAMVTFDGSAYKIGADFVSAVTGPYRSHGRFELRGGTRYAWQSSLSQQETETVLRAAAKREGRHISYFHSQAL